MAMTVSKMMRLALLGVTAAHAFNNAGRPQTRRWMPSIACAESSGQADHPLRQTVLAIALAGVLTSFCTVAPAGAVERDTLKGQDVFAASCNGCHAGGTNSIAVSKTLRKEALQRYVSASLDVDEVEAWWRSSFHKGSIAEKLTDNEIKDVLGFVVEQAANSRWP
mmetsp:Transcript_9063/g.21061  ORF Transcript_9063/g.21061 Transcript_9063/m.21061 type:complete len:165 (+) Transcript_9063:139-633(+)